MQFYCLGVVLTNVHTSITNALQVGRHAVKSSQAFKMSFTKVVLCCRSFHVTHDQTAELTCDLLVTGYVKCENISKKNYYFNMSDIAPDN